MNSRVQISKRLLLTNTISAATTRMANVVILLWVVRYLYQAASDEIPVLYVVTAVITVVPVFTALFTWALSRHVTEAYAQGNDQRVTEITSTIFSVLLLVSLWVLAAGSVAIYFIDHIILDLPRHLVSDARWMFSLLLVQVTTRLLLSPFTVGLFVHQRFVMLNLIDVSATLVRVLLLAALFAGVGPRALWMVLAQVVSNMLQDLCTVASSLRNMPSLRFDRRQVRWQTAASLISFNTWAVGNQLAWFLHDFAPVWVLNWFGTPFDVKTLYMPAQADIQLRNFVQSSTIPLLPVLTAMQATDQLSRLRNSFLRGCRWSMWLILYFVACLVVYREEVMRLYLGSKAATYPDSGIVLGMLLMAHLSYLPRLMLMKIALATARVAAVISYNLASQVCNAALMFILVAWLGTGAVGVGIATLSVEVVWHVLVWGPLSSRLVDLPLSQYVRQVCIEGAAPAVACGLVCELLRRLAHPTSLLSLALCGLAGLLVYAATLLGGCLSPADKNDLGRVKSSFLSRR